MDKKKMLESPCIVLDDVDVKWIKDLPSYALQNIHINIHDCQLVALVGPVGSGKSTLLNVLLKEIEIADGTFEINGKVSFASQEPWLFAASIRQNILFGNEYDQERYKTVLSVCALETDLKTFPFGDQTILSESGKSLSGGQKSRINLARCIYREADIYLLDDPLSAVDVEVGNHLYEQCIQKFLKDKICILVTHQLQYTQNADKIVIMNEGRIVGQGTNDQLQNSGLDFATLLKEFSPTDEQEKVLIYDDKLKTHFDIRETRNAVVCQQNKTREISEKGSVGLTIYLQYFKYGGGYFKMFCVFLLIFVAELVGISGDYFVSYWVTLEKKLTRTNDSTGSNPPMTRETIICIYSGITALTGLLGIIHGVLFFKFLTRASVNLHNTIFEKVSSATMRFFDINPTGRILNRFSKDLGVVDEYIPLLLIDVLRISSMIVSLEIISGLVNPGLLLPLVILSIIFYFSARIYVNLANCSKRIEAITRTPVFTHMTATINGLPTIRAFAAENKLLDEFDAHQDLHSSAWYLYLSSSRAYGLWLDLITTIILCCGTLYFLIIKEEHVSGNIGLMITQYVYVNIRFSNGIRQICDLENNMVSVERVIEYTKVKTEPLITSPQNLPKNWPERGKIEFRNVSMRYNFEENSVLKNLNLTFLPAEKIGIVGRTGAGKSSMIAALFQMYNTEGQILVDDVDVTKISRKDLRSKMSIIPQYPILFSGSIRKNLDPMEQYDDDVLWSALEQVELKKVIENLPGGLSTRVSQSGANFSTGQKQLVCFARAIVRKSNILVMDEATANVDPYTDSVIQNTIRKTFVDCTVLIIAHRLHTTINCDKVLVVDEGSVVEFDTPCNLLGSNNSIFYRMVQAAGTGTAKSFLETAEANSKKQI